MREFNSEENTVAIELARKDLYFFTRWMFLQRTGSHWVKAKHHQLICNALTKVFNGEVKRLIINIPPRYSKTEIAVVNFVAWAMGQVPDAEFIHCSYSSGLAVKNSSNIRTLIQHEAYQSIFPNVTLASEAKAHWETTKSGVFYATGAGGTITGFGAGKNRKSFGGAIIIDDPHKADEARSDVMRQNVIDWFQNTVESRTNGPETPIIVIMQRLHEDDLSGWLLDGGNGEQWEHLCLPAIQDDGTALWEDKHTIEKLREMEQASPYVFAGQYQQRPAPLDGGIFKPGQIEIIDALPAQMKIKWCRGWDLGATIGGDPTAGAKLGKCEDGTWIIADMAHGDLPVDKRDALIKNTATLDGKLVKISIPQDPGQAGKTQVVSFLKLLAGYRVSTSPENGDKVTRAEPFASQVNVGNVKMLRGEWNNGLINEMRMFPNGKHDDRIDALSRAFSELIRGSTSYFG